MITNNKRSISNRSDTNFTICRVHNQYFVGVRKFLNPGTFTFCALQKFKCPLSMIKSHDTQVFNESFSSTVSSHNQVDLLVINYQGLSPSIHICDFSSDFSIGAGNAHVLNDRIVGMSSTIWVPLSDNNSFNILFYPCLILN